MGIGSVGLAFLAGLLSVLAPCVLPLLPLVLGAAAGEHRMGPAALASGVALAFVFTGLFVATIGFAIGVDADVVRTAAAVLMIGIGVVLMSPALGMRLAMAGGPISQWADQRINGIVSRGLAGQFGVGLLLGAVWSPCVGPTLGAAALLAAQGRSTWQVGFTMAAFGVGAATPLIGIGLMSRRLLLRWRNGLLSVGRMARAGLGLVFVLLGAMVVSGSDKRVEAILVDWSPPWLTDLTTRF